MHEANDRCPYAIAHIKGGPLAPKLKGIALFYQCSDGVYIRIEVNGMPVVMSNGEEGSFHGLHIHEFGNCEVGDPTNPFLASGGHYNPTNKKHPFHAGDLPPLLANNYCNEYGSAKMSIKTNRFCVKDIINRSVIIHEGLDDFKTQPTGGAGKRWACGVIKKYS
ncbi:MAG: superoxide dismutase family protein [Paraclostridium sp.]